MEQSISSQITAEARLTSSSLVRAGLLLTRRVDEILKPEDISFARYTVLANLYRAEDNALLLKQLAELMAIHPTTITSSIDRLENDGLVERVKHPTDRRAILARLRPIGRKVYERGRALLAEHDYGIKGLTGDEAKALISLVSKLRIAWGDREDPEPEVAR